MQKLIPHVHIYAMRGCPQPPEQCAALESLEHIQRAAKDGHSDECICVAAAKTGRIDAFEWILEEGIQWNGEAYLTAAIYGHMELLRWLRSDDKCVGDWVITGYVPEWDSRTTHALAWKGELEHLQWAVSAGCPVDSKTCAFAARGGHLAALQWLHSVAGLMDELTCAYAASGDWYFIRRHFKNPKALPLWGKKMGSLELLMWAREAGAPWDARVGKYAADNGDTAMVQWIFGPGGAPTEWLGVAWCAAREGGHTELADWLMGVLP